MVTNVPWKMGVPEGSQNIWAPSSAHIFMSWACSPNLHPPLSFSTVRSLTTQLFLVTRYQPTEAHRTQARSEERAGWDFCPSSLPVGDGDQLRAMVGTQPPGITVGHLVLSQPVAGWAMPRPTLAREKRQQGGGYGRRTPPSAVSACAAVTSGHGWVCAGQRGLIWLRTSVPVVCSVSDYSQLSLPQPTTVGPGQGHCCRQLTALPKAWL